MRGAPEPDAGVGVAPALAVPLVPMPEAEAEVYGGPTPSIECYSQQSSTCKESALKLTMPMKWRLLLLLLWLHHIRRTDRWNRW
jgi:hypothetical protein